MAIAEVGGGSQRASGGDSGYNTGPFTLAYPNNVTEGNLLVGARAWWEANADGGAEAFLDVTDSLGTDYQVAISDAGATGSGTFRIGIWWGFAPSSGPNTVSVLTSSAPNNTDGSMSIDEFSGVDDVSVTGDTEVGTGTSAGNTLMTATDDELVLGVVTHNNNSNPSITVDGPATQIGEKQTSPDNQSHNFAFLIGGAAGSHGISWTLGASSGWSTLCVSFAKAASDARTGVLAVTLAALTAVGAGTVEVKGTATRTLGALTSAAAGTVAVQGSSARTLGALVSTATGTVEVKGAATPTLGALTSVAPGTVLVQGAAAGTLGALTSAAEGTVASALEGTLARTLDALTGVAAGTVEVRGATSATLGALAPSATGAVAVQGQAAATLGALTSDAAGVVGDPPIEGTLSQVLGAVTGASTGTVLVQGVTSRTLGACAVSAAGAVAVQGTASAALGACVAAATGAVEVQGLSARTLSALVVAASGEVSGGAIVGPDYTVVAGVSGVQTTVTDVVGTQTTVTNATGALG